MTTTDWIQLVVGIVLFLTLLALLWYAWETRTMAKGTGKLVRYAQLQLIAESQPFVLPKLRYQSSGEGLDFALTIKNVGKGPAVNLAVQVNILGKDIAGFRIYRWEILDETPEYTAEEPVVDSDPMDFSRGEIMAPDNELQLFYRLPPDLKASIDEIRDDTGVVKISYEDIIGSSIKDEVQIVREPKHGFVRLARFRHDVSAIEQ